MASQEELIVRIGADFDQLKKGLKGATKSIDKMGKESKQTSREMTIAFAKATLGVQALTASLKKAAMSAKAMTIDVVQNARQQTLWANRLQISREAFSSLVAVGNRFGVDMDTVGDVIKDLNERIADASTGTKTYEEALNRAGLKSKDLIDLSADQQFLKVADAIGKMNNAGQQNFVTAELMADAGFRMLEVFRQGEPKIQAMRKELQKTNVALSESDFDTLGALGKDFRDASEAMTRFSNTIAVLAAGPMHEMTQATKGWFDALTNNLLGNETFQKLKSYNEMLALIRKNGDNLKKQEEERNKEAKDMTFDEKMAGKQSPYDFELAPATFTGEQQSLLDLYLEEQEEIRQAAIDANNMTLIERGLFLDQLYEAERAHAERITKLWDQGYKGRMEVAKGFFGSMSVLMQTENRKMFEVGKAAATANAVISTIESAQKAFNSMAGIPIVGPALGAAAAAAAVAAGMARVQAIQSTTMGGGGGGFGGAGGAVSGGADVAQQAPENVIDATFNLQTEQGFVSADQIRSVASGLNEYIEDGGRIRSVSVL